MSPKTKFNLIALALALPIIAVEGYGLSDKTGAEKTLVEAGYTPVSYEGHRIFGCGKGDLFRDSFKVKNQQGGTTEVTVCKGILKGSTVRFG